MHIVTVAEMRELEIKSRPRIWTYFSYIDGERR